MSDKVSAGVCDELDGGGELCWGADALVVFSGIAFVGGVFVSIDIVAAVAEKVLLHADCQRSEDLS